MRFISDIEEFNSLYNLIGARLSWSPERLENERNPIVEYTDWNELARENGFKFILSLAKSSNENEFYFFAPELHIFADFAFNARVFPIVELNARMTEDEIFKGLSIIPPGAKFCLDFSTNSEFAIFPKSLKWYAYGNYAAELSKIVSYVDIPQVINNVPNFLSKNQVFKKLSSLIPQKAKL